MSDSQTPFDFFRSEGNSPDAVIRTEAMQKATIICSLMTPEKARSDLLPYLLSKKDDLDQVLLAIARCLGDFLSHIGGPEHSPSLIPLFEMLCAVEETVVRSAATASMNKVLAQLNIGANRASAKSYLELFLRLANDESGEVFYTRAAACQFVAELHRALPEASDRATLREGYAKLARDELAIVRRAAVQSFTALSVYCGPEVQQGELARLLREVSGDEQISVRVIAIESFVPFAKSLKDGGNSAVSTAELVPLIKTATADFSWRVRYAIAKNYGDFAAHLPADAVRTELFPGAVNLLQDSEPDVRMLMCRNVLPFLSVVGGEPFLTEIVPLAQALADDLTSTVRKAAAEMSVSLAAKLTSEPSARHILDLVVKIMEDEDPLVRLRVIKMIPAMVEEVPSLCTRLAATLKAHICDSNWRVRKQMAHSMPSLLRHMGQEYFTENFLADYLSTLRDGVDDVRLGATSVLPGIAAASSPAWIQEHVFPSVRTMASEGYASRLSMLNALRSLLSVDGMPERFQTEVLTLIIAATNDTVPNVRLLAAQVLGFASSKLGAESGRVQVRPILNELAVDKDKDVKYFANEALKLCA